VGNINLAPVDEKEFFTEIHVLSTLWGITSRKKDVQFATGQIFHTLHPGAAHIFVLPALFGGNFLKYVREQSLDLAVSGNRAKRRRSSKPTRRRFCAPMTRVALIRISNSMNAPILYICLPVVLI